MAEHILFLTGRLAYTGLCREIEGLAQRSFTYTVHDLGLKVAGLMTVEMIARRLQDTFRADRVLVPGLCRGDLVGLQERLGVAVQRGPVDLKDLAEFFGTRGSPSDLSQHAVILFAEIVDAPELTLQELLQRAEGYRDGGADVIDIGCLPETPFPHLSEAVSMLKAQGFVVSVDSMNSEELLAGGRAGADYLLSLKESTLWIADEVPSVPVVIPEQGGGLESLLRACEAPALSGRRYLADPILDPIPFGFAASIARYHALRERRPDVEIMMGTGNVTELTDADTTGMSALLLGIVSELDINAVLTTQVSPHACRVVRETDLARRIMHAAKRDARLPRGYHAGLMALRDRKPFPYSPAEIEETASAVTDPSFRIQVSEHGIHVFNRDGLRVGRDPFHFLHELGVETDGPHAFYLGVELARAQIAWQLGKRYWQDRLLDWGCAARDVHLAVDGADATGSGGAAMDKELKR